MFIIIGSVGASLAPSLSLSNGVGSELANRSTVMTAASRHVQANREVVEVVEVVES